MQTTAIGFLGTTLDRGGHGQRWERWLTHGGSLPPRGLSSSIASRLLIEPRFARAGLGGRRPTIVASVLAGKDDGALCITLTPAGSDWD
jgi:sigma54-dependent transcription regulator